MGRDIVTVATSTARPTRVDSVRMRAAAAVESGAGRILSPLDGVTPLEEMRWPPGSEPGA